MDTFVHTIRKRILDKDPHRTELDLQHLLTKSFEVLSKCPIRLEHVSSEGMPDLKIKKDILFMSRRLPTEELPHTLPSGSQQFFETCNGVYQDYMTTLCNLLGERYIQTDLEMLRSILQENRSCTILCWSNTSIILSHVLKDMTGLENLSVVTFGSPILLPADSFKCLNIYHEDDWILGFHESLFVKDKVVNDCVSTYIDDKQNIYKYLKLSRHNFNKICDPHESYFVLL